MRGAAKDRPTDSYAFEREMIIGTLVYMLKETDKLNFLVIQLFRPEDGEKLLLFKKHIKNAANLKTKTARFSFNGKEFRPFTDRILTIGRKSRVKTVWIGGLEKGLAENIA